MVQYEQAVALAEACMRFRIELHGDTPDTEAMTIERVADLLKGKGRITPRTYARLQARVDAIYQAENHDGVGAGYAL